MSSRRRYFALAGIVAMLFAAPLSASAAVDQAEPDRTSTTSAVSSPGGAARLLNGHTPAASVPDEPELDASVLEELDVTGTVTNVEVDQNGAVFYFYDSGDYVFKLPDEVPTADGIVSAQWSAGTHCVGNFVNMYRDSAGALYWGGQNYCTGTNNVYVHELKMTLRSGCTGWLCSQVSIGSVTAPGSAYDMVKTVSDFRKCPSTAERRYDQIAYPKVRGVQFGPIVDTENFVIKCGL